MPGTTCSYSAHCKALGLVTHYKHSNVALQALFKTQEQLCVSKNRLIQDEPTRWNTTFYMLQRLLEQKKAVIATNVELNVPFELTNAQWVLAEKVVKILQVYEEATRSASGNYSTAAVIIPIVNSIQKFLQTKDMDHGVTRMKEVCCSNFLDPRLKDKVFSSTSSGMTAKQMLTSLFEAEAQKQKNDLPPDSTQVSEVTQQTEEESQWPILALLARQY